MKILGWIFAILAIAGLGYAVCHFGWLDQLVSLIQK